MTTIETSPTQAAVVPSYSTRIRKGAATWEVQPPSNVADRWRTLVAAFVSHEFVEAGLPAPPWTEAPKLATEWVLDTPRLTADEIKRQTPDWLAERNIFIAEKDLVTL